MNRLTGLALSAVINAALLGLLQWSSVTAQRAPAGEVLISELPSPAGTTYAQLRSGELG